jgi:hypothetical protein
MSEPIVRPSVGSAPDEVPLTYRPLHVSTGKENTYSVRHMFPLLHADLVGIEAKRGGTRQPAYQVPQ